MMTCRYTSVVLPCNTPGSDLLNCIYYPMLFIDCDVDNAEEGLPRHLRVETAVHTWPHGTGSMDVIGH